MDLKLKLKNLRIKYNYSQENIAEVLDISVRQYQRIENGDNKPSLDMLMNLSKIYNSNLINDYILSNDSSYLYIKELELKLKNIAFNIDIDNLKIFINNIQSAINQDPKSTHLSQILYFSKAYKSIIENQYIKAKSYLERAIFISIPDFEIKNIENYLYNKFEIKVLLHLGITYKYLGQKDKHEAIILFLYSLNLNDIELELQIAHAKIKMHISKKNYIYSLEIINYYIKLIEDNHLYQHKFRFSYLKGLCLYKLDDSKYAKYFDDTLRALEYYKLKNLYEQYNKSILKYKKFNKI